MIPEIRQIKMNLTLFEQGVEEFMKKAEQAAFKTLLQIRSGLIYYDIL